MRQRALNRIMKQYPNHITKHWLKKHFCSKEDLKFCNKYLKALRKDRKQFDVFLKFLKILIQNVQTSFTKRTKSGEKHAVTTIGRAFCVGYRQCEALKSATKSKS